MIDEDYFVWDMVFSITFVFMLLSISFDLNSLGLYTSAEYLKYIENIPTEFSLNFKLMVLSLIVLVAVSVLIVGFAVVVGRMVINLCIYFRCRKTYRLYTPVVNK